MAYIFTRSKTIPKLLSESREIASDLKSLYNNIGESCATKAQKKEERRLDRKLDGVANKLGLDLGVNGEECKVECINAVDPKHAKTRLNLMKKYFR